MLNKIMQWLGLAPSEDDKKIIELVENAPQSIRVVGRGTVTVDPKEVYESSEFKAAKKRAKKIVEHDSKHKCDCKCSK